MQKALTIAAIASLSLASDVMEDNQLGFFKTLGNDIKKAGQFVVQHPQIITTAVKILAVDDEISENELNFFGTIAKDAKKAGNFVVQHPELIKTAVQILHHDDEISENELNFFKSLGNGIKKAANFVIEHPQVVSTASKILARDDEIGDDELNFWGSLKTDVKKAGEFVVQHPQIVTTAVKILAKDDEIENELNIFKSIGNGLKKAGQFVVQHPQIITTAAKFLDDEDEELFNLGKTVKNVAHAAGKVGTIAKDGLNVYKDVQTGNYLGAIQHGAQTVKDIKHHDDEELMTIYDPTIYDPIFGNPRSRIPIYRPTPTFPERPILAFSDEELNILSTIKKDAKKAAEYAVSHPELVVKAVEIVKALHHDDEAENELNIFKSIGNGLKKAGQFVVQHPQIITTAAKFLDDEDQELFNLGKTIGKVGHIAKDGLNVYKDVQTGNYLGAIKHGAQTVKDIKHHDDEELFNLGKTIGKVAHVAKDGLNVYKDVQTGNYLGAIKHGAQTVKDIKHHDDEELFNIHNAIHKAEEGVKKGVHYVEDHPEVIKQAVELVKILSHHDDEVDEELFSLGKAIGKVAHVAKDGLNVYKDVQTGNYLGAIKHGAQTVKDIKHHDDEELFNIHNALHHAEEGVRKAGEYVAKHPETVKKAEQTIDEIIHAAGHKDVRRQAAKQALKYVAQHPEVIKKAVEKVESLIRHHKTKKTEAVADEALFNLGNLINDGLNIYGDIKTKNYGGLVNHGIQTVKDIKKHDDEELMTIYDPTVFNPRTRIPPIYRPTPTFPERPIIAYSDEELFNIHNAIHKAEEGVKNAVHRAGEGVKVAEHYVYDHRREIGNGAKKAVDYVAEHPEVVKQAIEIIKNLKHHDDEELFNLGGLIKDGLNIAKDVKSHNYGDLVGHGIQTVKDVKQTVKDVKQRKFLGH